MIKEGKCNKGGRNDLPSSPRPAVPPLGQIFKTRYFLVEDWGYDGLSITPYKDYESLESAIRNTEAFYIEVIEGRRMRLKFKSGKYWTNNFKRGAEVQFVGYEDEMIAIDSVEVKKIKAMKALFGKAKAESKEGGTKNGNSAD